MYLNDNSDASIVPPYGEKPKCEWCGYIAEDNRDLNNHQLKCDKKPKNEL